jgi:hypothetical protein
MSKKRASKSISGKPTLGSLKTTPLPPATFGSSMRSLWRRNGLFLAIGLFILSNLALRGVDSQQISSTAFPIIAVLTVISIGLAVGYGLEYMLIQRRARFERWDVTRWHRWREGF